MLVFYSVIVVGATLARINYVYKEKEQDNKEQAGKGKEQDNKEQAGKGKEQDK